MKINKYRCMWVVSLFLILIIILYLVIKYKIYYQYLEHNYIYFYECSGNLCTSSMKDDSKLLYSTYDCSYDECPSFSGVINDNYVLLKGKDNILFNYKDGRVISFIYDNYYFIDNEYIIVYKDDKYGIINVNGNVVCEVDYDEIGIIKDDVIEGVLFDNIIVKKDQKYGIISYKSGLLKENLIYDNKDIVLNLLEEKNK